MTNPNIQPEQDSYKDSDKAPEPQGQFSSPADLTTEAAPEAEEKPAKKAAAKKTAAK